MKSLLNVSCSVSAESGRREFASAAAAAIAGAGFAQGASVRIKMALCYEELHAMIMFLPFSFLTTLVYSYSIVNYNMFLDSKFL
jgi:predicted esterase